MLAESLTTMRDAGEKLGLHGVIDTYAYLAFIEGRAERAVRLAGAAARLRASAGTHAWPVVRRSARWLATARQTLDNTTFHTAWAHGQAMSPSRPSPTPLSPSRPTPSSNETRDKQPNSGVEEVRGRPTVNTRWQPA